MLFTTNFVQIALLASAAAAVPLNINLGAYSPAIVVGDGAIEFSGGDAAAAVAAAAAAATKDTSKTVAAAAVPASSAVAASKDSPVAAVQNNAADSSILNEEAFLPAPGSDTKELDPRL